MERNVPNDFVSRYELVKHLVGVHDGWRIPFGYTVEDEIINFPAADVAPVRHAYKIDITTAEDFLHWYKCSDCGYDELFLEDEYCSHCGAIMDGGQDK